jgi:hypothetical protein
LKVHKFLGISRLLKVHKFLRISHLLKVHKFLGISRLKIIPTTEMEGKKA